jgi:transcription termination factor Rho
MRVLLGTSLALALAAATPVAASPADAVGNQGAESMYDQAPAYSGDRADRRDRADRGDRVQRRAEREARRAARGDRADRGDRGDRANRGERRRQFAMGDRVPRKFLAGRRVVTDYARYGVQRPSGGDQWVRGRKQLLLVSADGVVKSVVERHKRRHRDRADRAQAQPAVDQGTDDMDDEGPESDD